MGHERRLPRLDERRDRRWLQPLRSEHDVWPSLDRIDVTRRCRQGGHQEVRGDLGQVEGEKTPLMATVETKAIRKDFGGTTAVDGIDLQIREGEFLVLLGPSGCGKTTLLRMIAGLEKQTSGDIVIGGRVVNDLPPRARKIAMVFQSYALYPHLTVEKNIAFPLRAQGAEASSISGKVQKAASMLGLGALLHRKPRQLSGGERQRVALARAMVREPDVLLLDEPLSNLAANLRTLARDELQSFQRRLSPATSYATHD